MSEALATKTDQYERMLEAALAEATVAVSPESPLATAAGECLEMAEAYLEDGRHFLEAGDRPNALAAFAYGHGWLDAGVRFGLFEVPEDSGLFTT